MTAGCTGGHGSPGAGARGRLPPRQRPARGLRVVGLRAAVRARGGGLAVLLVVALAAVVLVALAALAPTLGSLDLARIPPAAAASASIQSPSAQETIAGPPSGGGVSPAQVGPASVLYFVYQGDIWRYDDDTGEATVAVAANDKAIGHPSWSLDGTALAWEEREVVEGRQISRVVFQGPPGVPGGSETSWVVEGASSPAVSPDGRYVLYETEVESAAGKSAYLDVVDSNGQPILSLPDARDGSWDLAGSTPPDGSTAPSEEPSPNETGLGSAAGAGLRIAFDRGGSDPFSNPGFYVYDMESHQESIAPLANVWAPQAGPAGDSFLTTAYTEGGTRAQIVRTVGSASDALVDVSRDESFDYRWLRSKEGTDVPFLELAPMGGGRSDISRYNDSGDQPGPELSLLDSSFGWNASLPVEPPFPDIRPGDAYYSAAALLWTDGVIGGFGDGTFRSSALLCRAQFAKMLTGTIGTDVYEGLPVAGLADLGEDVATLYPREYVCAAFYQGLVHGYPNGLFRPWGEVSRMQAVTMVVRAAGVYLPRGLAPVPQGWNGATSRFSEPDHGDNLHVAEYNGLLAGVNLTHWDPTAPATRGEAVQLLANLMRLRGPLYDGSDTLLGPSGLAAGSTAGAAPRVSPPPPLGKIVFDGDSLTAGSTATDPYPNQVMRTFLPGVDWVSLAKGGQRLLDILDNAPADVDPLYEAAIGQNVVVVWAGTNDIRHWGHKPEIVYSRLRDYCLARRHAGFTVIALTLLPRSDGVYPLTFESDRQLFNSKVRATWPGFADAIVDVGADELIGPQGSELNVRFYSTDRVHLNNLGLSVVAGRVGQLLQRLDAASMAAAG